MGKLANNSNAITRLLIENFEDIKRIVPSHVTPERLARVALTSVTRSPKLGQCTPESVVEGIMNAASVGLEVNDGTGRAYLIPYGRQATLVIGYPGLLELAWRSGQIKTIYTYPVFRSDAFVYSLGLEPKLEHVPSGDTDPGELTHAYAVARLKADGFLFEVMTRAQIEGIRNRSRSGSNGPWQTDFTEMARKTVLRRLCKMVPKSVELQKASNWDLEAELGPFGVESKHTVAVQVEEPEHDADGVVAEIQADIDRAGITQDDIKGSV